MQIVKYQSTHVCGWCSRQFKTSAARRQHEETHVKRGDATPEEMLVASQMSDAEFRVMGLLLKQEAKNGVTRGVLCTMLNLARTTVYDALWRLATRGLVTMQTARIPRGRPYTMFKVKRP